MVCNICMRLIGFYLIKEHLGIWKGVLKEHLPGAFACNGRGALECIQTRMHAVGSGRPRSSCVHASKHACSG
jgi:hypothetical protein